MDQLLDWIAIVFVVVGLVLTVLPAEKRGRWTELPTALFYAAIALAIVAISIHHRL